MSRSNVSGARECQSPKEGAALRQTEHFMGVFDHVSCLLMVASAGYIAVIVSAIVTDLATDFYFQLTGRPLWCKQSP